MYIKAIRIKWEKPISEQKLYRQMRIFESNATETAVAVGVLVSMKNKNYEINCWNVEVMCKIETRYRDEWNRKIDNMDADSKWSTKKRRLRDDGLSDDIISQIVFIVVGVSLKKKKSKKIGFVDKRPVEMNSVTIKMNK